MKFALFSFLLLAFLLFTAEECENKTIQQVVIAPNPANDHFKLSFVLTEESDINITVADINGNTVLQPNTGMNFHPGENECDIQTSNLTNGTYFLMIKNSKDMVSQKLVILH